jgi:hypothetical protein
MFAGMSFEPMFAGVKPWLRNYFCVFGFVFIRGRFRDAFHELKGICERFALADALTVPVYDGAADIAGCAPVRGDAVYGFAVAVAYADVEPIA